MHKVAKSGLVKFTGACWGKGGRVHFNYFHMIAKGTWDYEQQVGE